MDVHMILCNWSSACIHVLHIKTTLSTSRVSRPKVKGKRVGSLVITCSSHSFLASILVLAPRMSEPIHTPAVERDPPSLPASPSPKRVKHIEPVGSLSVACKCMQLASRASVNGPECCNVSTRLLNYAQPSSTTRPPLLLPNLPHTSI
jgi:hypothetical protein